MTERPCCVCGNKELDTSNPLIDDNPWYAVHLNCLNTPAFFAFNEKLKRADKDYARYSDLITVGLVIHCEGCGLPHDLSPKGVGFDPTWELYHCSDCATKSEEEINPYDHLEIVNALDNLSETFAMGASWADVGPKVEALALSVNDKLDIKRCSCGGAFSLTAHPRCHGCNSVLIESAFHFTLDLSGSDEAAQE
ncbi:hypothetical protein [Loktanella sp. S4079]|uniref:hypothetical protein n=1 Tax=Loktanella sp. S4079 TaxID=579483 RepID=UPI0005FA7CDE|nr:hypothetical protein [Loktanella sp. S4079]KJZ20154.1 hypothetical protein TW80_04775 [Loktanella sp. S4079]